MYDADVAPERFAYVPSSVSDRAHCQLTALTLPSGSARVAVNATPTAGVSAPNVTDPASSTFVTVTVTASVTALPCWSDAFTVTS